MHLHIHLHDDRETKQLLELIIKQNKIIMAKQDQFDAAIVRLNAVTNDIAADLTLLKDQIATGTVSQASLDALDANIAQLEVLGASTENPVHEPPAEPPV